MNEQQMLETQEVVTLHNKQKQLDYMMQVAVDTIMEAREPSMKPQFIRIGDKVINLALVTSVKLETNIGYSNKPVVLVCLMGGAEVWFQNGEYETAAAFFRSISKEVTR
jgi:hypothetical protein